MADYDPRLRIVDVAAHARELFGEKGAAFIIGRPLPEHDYRFEVDTPTGGEMTLAAGDTAADVAASLDRLRAEVEQQSTS
jgi:hypothetical protein